MADLLLAIKKNAYYSNKRIERNVAMSSELRDLQKYSNDIGDVFLTIGTINEETRAYIRTLCVKSHESSIVNTTVGSVFFVGACCVLFIGRVTVELSAAVPIFVLSFYFFVRSYTERKLVCRYELILFMSYQQKELVRRFKNV